MDEDSRTVWCGNLSEKVTEEILYELFLQAGPLENVSIPKRRSGGQRFGFVTFEHDCSVPYSMALFQGISLYKEPLILKMRNKLVKTNSSETEISSGIYSDPYINLSLQLGNQMIIPGYLYNLMYPGHVNQFNILSSLYASQMSSVHYFAEQQHLIDNALHRGSKNNRENHGNRNHPYYHGGSSRNHEYNYNGQNSYYHDIGYRGNGGR